MISRNFWPFFFRNDQEDIPDFEGEQQQDDMEYEEDDFIVGPDGQPLRGEKRKKKTHFFENADLQMAEDIFGVDCDFGVFAEDDEDIDEEDYEDEDEDGGLSRRKRGSRKAKNIFEMYEPSELEARNFTDKDNEIRNSDIPERMQLRNPPVSHPENDDEIIKEAEWIFDRLTKVISQKNIRASLCVIISEIYCHAFLAKIS